MKQQTLAKESRLWEEGDAARTIAVLETGKLGIELQARRVGILYPRAVVGEAALLAAAGEDLARTASVISLDADTKVTLYDVDEVRKAFETGDHAVPGVIQKTLIAQICRNCILVASATPDLAMVEGILRGLGQGLSGFASEFKPAATWQLYRGELSFLCELRDFTDRLWDQCSGYDEAEVVDKASQQVRHLYPAGDLGDVMGSFLRAERERLLGE